MSTYKRGFSAYRRVWQTTPASRRIVEDIDAIAGTYKEIIKHEGILCPADKNSGGNRFHRRGGHGGKREKGVSNVAFNKLKREITEDAQPAVDALIAKAVAKSVAKAEVTGVEPASNYNKKRRT